MIVQCVTAAEYAAAFPEPRFVYDSVDFTSTVLANATQVAFCIGYYQPGKPLLGITLGADQRGWRCPFSAPFGSILCRGEQSLGAIYDFIAELTDFLGAPVRITLPPMLHADNNLVKITGTLNSLANRRIDDFNFHFPLPLTAEQLLLRMVPAARRNLRRALASGLVLEPTTDIDRAYQIIDLHHKEKGYRMAMSADAVKRTAAVVSSDFFVVTHQGRDIAAAYIQRVGDDTAQLINWGDLPGNQLLRPMNFMAYSLALHYSRLGMKAFDLGPASTDGIPNAGLCRFKEDIGCDITLKHTFIL